uniref:Uncharacterized protein n=1 Tax=Tetraselmis sp. GSL018 TaxID=582737 RepID=A0A061RBA2_9CHLO
MDPNADEARAAHYNSACCYTKLRKWDEAADSVVSAVNDYDLKFIVALKDDDLKELREQPVFDRVVGEVTGGLSQEAYIKARQEARSPFMLVRTIALGGLSAGAALGLIIITGRLIAAIRGGEGAPDLQQTLQNFGINAGALALLVFLLARDQRRKKRELGVIEREERLAKLQVQDDGGRPSAASPAP